jgi:hypothetical protein
MFCMDFFSSVVNMDLTLYVGENMDGSFNTGTYSPHVSDYIYQCDCHKILLKIINVWQIGVGVRDTDTNVSAHKLASTLIGMNINV